MLQIVYCLMGDDRFPPILDRQMDEFVYRLRDEVEDLIWEGRLRGYASAGILYECYDRLSDADRARLFLSPEGYEAVCGAVSARTAEALAALAEAVERVAVPAVPAPADYPEGELPDRVLIGGTLSLIHI